ncbi:unnamed protein product [Psylliodes chrysocephalus]|uniref:MADF domain-containing protein n=1 Tax=Psylliodes chrysocephalus TaxID=3402493 RepID=A0A9P0GC61_9CUCU|nr:unnamed protein product [Psylliodes chrysocephala]
MSETTLAVSKQFWNPDLTTALILMYENFPCLYNVRSKDYHNRNLRVAAIRNICLGLKETYPNTGVTEAMVQKKIHGIRTQYNSEINKIKKSELTEVLADSKVEDDLAVGDTDTQTPDVIFDGNVEDLLEVNMQNAFYDFLSNRKISEEVINFFKDQNEDKPLIVLEKAKNLFFPDGNSAKGNLQDVHCTLLDFKQLPVDNGLSIGDIFNITGVTKLRFYLATKNACSDSDGSVHLESNDSDVSSLQHVAFEEKEENHETSDLMVNTSPEVEISRLDFVEDLVGLPYVELWDDSQSKMETLILHRGQIFQDMLKAFEEEFFDHGNLKIEMILPNGQSELAEDIGGVYRDSLSECWFSFYEKCTVGTTFKVPYLRHDFGEKQWKSIAKIFIRGFELENYIPIKLSPK